MPAAKKILAICLLTLFTGLALPLLAQGTKVKVIVENASIRLKPSLDSEAIEEAVPLNTVLTSDKKVGEWYEVKFESKVGVLLIGYIHEMYVEVVAEGPAPPPVREAEKPVVKEPPPPPPGPSPYLETGMKFIELYIGGGLGFGSPLPSGTAYTDHWGVTGPLDYMDATGRVSHKAGGPKGLGFSLAYFFSGGFGLRLRVDLDFSQTMTGDSTYSLTWKWWDRGPYTQNDNWDFTGSLSVIPISLNAVYKFNLGQLSPYFSAGPAFFLGKLKMDTTLGLDTSWSYGGYRYIDYFAIPAAIDQSINGIGFNLGAGLDVVLSPSFGLTLDLSYFFKGATEAAWNYTAGTYDSHVNAGWEWTLNANDLKSYLDFVPPVSVKLSFFKILLGLKIFL